MHVEFQWAEVFTKYHSWELKTENLLIWSVLITKIKLRPGIKNSTDF